MTDGEVRKTKIQCLMNLLNRLQSSKFTLDLCDKVQYWRKPSSTTTLVENVPTDDEMARQYMLVERIDKGATEWKTWQRLAQAQLYSIFNERVGENPSPARKKMIKVCGDWATRLTL